MITVSLPVYASPIAWLAMESLCRQKTFIQWELIVFEDEQYPNGEDFYRAYWSRLESVGCRMLFYKYSSQRISLAEKWKSMFMKAAPDSIGIILQAADNYSEPLRIQRAHEDLKDGNDWRYCPKTIFYQLQKKKFMLYNAPNIGIGADMAISKEVAQQIPDKIQWSSVDTWIFENLKKIKPFPKIKQDEHGWHEGLATDGENRISLHRKKQFDNPKQPFYKTNIIPDIPKEIWERLKQY